MNRSGRVINSIISRFCEVFFTSFIGFFFIMRSVVHRKALTF
jgi:hypothetical protein